VLRIFPVDLFSPVSQSLSSFAQSLICFGLHRFSCCRFFIRLLPGLSCRSALELLPSFSFIACVGRFWFLTRRRCSSLSSVLRQSASGLCAPVLVLLPSHELRVPARFASVVIFQFYFAAHPRPLCFLSAGLCFVWLVHN
jgi:hypothetical protein